MEKTYNTGETESELKEKYNSDSSERRKIQLRMLEMLKFVDKICEENNIEYFISYGTLLGAVRHGGFIPWDDDTDVIISPKGMKKFRKIVNKGNFPYVVQDHTKDKGFLRHYNVLRDINSEYVIDDYIHNHRTYRGVQVDLFPYGYGVKKTGRYIVHKLTSINEFHMLGKHPFFENMIFGITRYMVIPILKFFALFRKKDYLCLGYENEWDLRYKKTDIYPLKKISFEGYKFWAPNNPAGMLSVDYGEDFNNLPSVDNRNKHKIQKVNIFD